MRRRGSMLLEVCIAAGLSAVAMIAVAQLLAAAAQQERALDRRRLAAQEAANTLERILASPWEQLTTERLAEMSLTPSSNSRLVEARLACELESTTDPLPAKKIDVEVSWANRAGDRERVRLSAWRFDAGKKP